MYIAKEEKEIKNGDGCWSSTLVGIYDGKTKIGEYERNYHSHAASTFCPFKKDNKWYALYSRDYTSTRVMSLPDCKDLGGESPDEIGFCPVDYYVPQVSDKVHKFTLKDKDGKEQEYTAFNSVDKDVDIDIDSGNPELVSVIGTFGFVAGCVWGDDSSWKIQWLDLSKVDKGIIKREDKFGYIEMPDVMRLKKAVRSIWIMKTAIQVKLNIQMTWRQTEHGLICYGKEHLKG